MASEADFLHSFNQIKDLHNDAFRAVDVAISCEEDENPDEALKSYKKSIVIIDKALSTPVGLPENVDDVREYWNEACQMIHKLKCARAEVVQRVSILTLKRGITDAELPQEVDEVPPKQKAIFTPEKKDDGRSRTYSELIRDLKVLHNSADRHSTLELIFICDGVKLYNIKPNGTVTTNSDKKLMRILRLDKNLEKHLSSTFFIQIIKSKNAIAIDPCEESSDIASCSDLQVSESTDNFNAQNESSWIYPLHSDSTACFRTEYGAFIFPDLESIEAGAAFGIVVPQTGKANEVVLEIFETILGGEILQFKEEDHQLAKNTSAQVSEDIVRGAQFVSRNLIKGAEKTGQWISYTTPYLISKIRGAPSDVAPVSSTVQDTVAVAKSVTGVAAGVTGYIAGKVGSATMALGRFLAPHVQKQGSAILTKGFGMHENDAMEKMEGALIIAAGAVEGFGTVYAGLEDSAKILANNLSNNSVKIIEHRYGPDAGSLASGTFDTVGNVVNLSQNLNYITPKGLAKRTAKNAGKALIQDYKPVTQQATNVVPAYMIYPDLKSLEVEIKK